MSVLTTSGIQNNELVASHPKITRFFGEKLFLKILQFCIFLACLCTLSYKVQVFKLFPQILNDRKLLSSLSFHLFFFLFVFSFSLPPSLPPFLPSHLPS